MATKKTAPSETPAVETVAEATKTIELEVPESPGVVLRKGKRLELGVDEAPADGDTVIAKQGPRVKQRLVVPVSDPRPAVE